MGICAGFAPGMEIIGGYPFLSSDKNPISIILALPAFCQVKSEKDRQIYGCVLENFVSNGRFIPIRENHSLSHENPPETTGSQGGSIWRRHPDLNYEKDVKCC